MANAVLQITDDKLQCTSTKVYSLMFDNNLGKCRSIFNIFYQLICRKIFNVICMHHKDFHLTCSMSQHYLVKFENRKMLRNFHFERNNYHV